MLQINWTPTKIGILLNLIDFYIPMFFEVRDRHVMQNVG